MLLFLIDIYIFGFDIAPDFVGWMSMLGAVAMLTGKVKGIERIRTFGQIMLGYEVAMVVMNYIGGMLPFYEIIMGYVGIFILCIRMYFMYIILTAAAEVGMVEGGEEKTIQGICRSRSLVLLAELTLYLYAAVQGTESLGGWGILLFGGYVVFYLACIMYLSFLKEEVQKQEKKQTDALAAKLGDNEFEEEILDIFKYIMKNSRRIQAKSLFDYNIFLIGFMGAGKSTVAGELKDKLEMDRVEMDQMIVENRGMSISEIFDEFGEAYFRNLESNTLIELQKRKQTIVSCGGGVVMREENSDHMKKNGRVVLLTAKPETIYERVKDSDERPILNGNMNVEYISGLMEKRKERYEAVADVTVATDGKNVTQICEEIIAKLIALDNEQGNKQA